MDDKIFATLKNILTPYAAHFVVKRDMPDDYYLDTVKTDGKPEMFAAVQMKKNYVSFHLFPVYLDPSLLNDISDSLRKHMHGKSCFNFRQAHELPTAELSALVAQCAAVSKSR